MLIPIKRPHRYRLVDLTLRCGVMLYMSLMAESNWYWFCKVFYLVRKDLDLPSSVSTKPCHVRSGRFNWDNLSLSFGRLCLRCDARSSYDRQSDKVSHKCIYRLIFERSKRTSCFVPHCLHACSNAAKQMGSLSFAALMIIYAAILKIHPPASVRS